MTLSLVGPLLNNKNSYSYSYNDGYIGELGGGGGGGGYE